MQIAKMLQTRVADIEFLKTVLHLLSYFRDKYFHPKMTNNELQSREREITQILGARIGTETYFSGSLFLIFSIRWSQFLFPTETRDPLNTAIWKLICGRVSFFLN